MENQVILDKEQIEENPFVIKQKEIWAIINGLTYNQAKEILGQVLFDLDFNAIVKSSS